MGFISEAYVEIMLLGQLEGLRYSHLADSVVGLDRSASELEAYSDLVLLGRLEAAVDQLNQDISVEARHDVL